MVSQDAQAAALGIRAELTTFQKVWRIALRQPLGVISVVILFAILLSALFAPLVSPYDINERDTAAILQGPSVQHVFGTDQLGRDIFSRMVFGARLSMTIGMAVTVVAASGGLMLGLASGYFGGWLDKIFIMLADALMAFPGLILAIALVSALGASVTNVILALLVGSTARMARVVRSEVLSVRNMAYVEAARAIGCGHLRTTLLHIAPNVFASVIVLSSLGFAGTILAESSLSFLGLGPPPPTPTWGRMLSEGRSFFRANPWIVIVPGLLITIVVYSLNMLGDAMRDELDPRLRGGR